MYSLVGIFIWNTLLICLGYFFVNKIEIVGEYYNNYRTLLIVFFVIVSGFLLHKWNKKRKMEKTINGD